MYAVVYETMSMSNKWMRVKLQDDDPTAGVE